MVELICFWRFQKYDCEICYDHLMSLYYKLKPTTKADTNPWIISYLPWVMQRALGQTLNRQHFLYTICFWHPPGKYMIMPLGLFAISLSVTQTTVKLCQFHHKPVFLYLRFHSLHTINHVKVLKFKSSANFFLVETKSGLFRTSFGGLSKRWHAI